MRSRGSEDNQALEVLVYFISLVLCSFAVDLLPPVSSVLIGNLKKHICWLQCTHFVEKHRIQLYLFAAIFKRSPLNLTRLMKLIFFFCFLSSWPSVGPQQNLSQLLPFIQYLETLQKP